MPRRYTLGKRIAQVEATRGRIIDAAMRLYLERGISATTLGDVARAADVAPGTVLNHFGTTDVLAGAVVQQILGMLQLPTPERFSGSEPIPGRIRRLAHELYAFYDRSASWWQVWSREPRPVPAWAAAEASFYADFDRLIRAALGPVADDETAVVVASTLLGGEVYGSMLGRGLDSGQAADVVAELLGPWLEGTRPPKHPTSAQRLRLRQRG